MDWSVTARTTEPHIRQTVADRELETWLVADLSASLDFGTTGCEKRDLVVAAAAAVGHLTRGGGNRIGAVISTGTGLTRIPARGGQPYLQHLLRELASTPRAEPTLAGDRGDLAAALEQLRRPPRRRGLAVVISDFLGEITWERSLRALSARHDLLAIEVLDPRDLELPAVGLVTLVDPETGRTKEVQTTPALRSSFAAAAAEHRQQVAIDDPPGRCGPVDPAHRPGLDCRRAALRADPQARLDRRVAGRTRRGGLVKFSTPGWFALIAVVVALAVGYALAQLRRRKHTLRFANFDMLDKVAPRRPSALRHVPTVIVLVGLMLLVVALAGPTAEAKVPRNRATVMLAIDVSLSMEATDVAPNRLAAAQEAATQFVERPDARGEPRHRLVRRDRHRAGLADHRPGTGPPGDRRPQAGRTHRHR